LETKALDLSTVFTQKDISEAIQALSKKKYKKNFSELKRFSFTQEKKETELGEYLKRLNENDYVSRLNRFTFKPYTGIKILKKSGKSRPLLVPKPKDRIVLASSFIKIRNILEDELASRRALGLGLNKKDKKSKKETAECRIVLENILNDISQGYIHVLKLDFKDFFSSIGT
jgi:hypothetical protein